MRRHVVVTTAALPPLREQPRAAPGQLPSPRLRTQGPGREDVCPLGHADDTQAITLEPRPGAQGVSDSQAVLDRTAIWLADTGQNANAAKSSSWRMSDQQAQPVTLHGVPVPLAREFKPLGVRVRPDPEGGTGPVLQERFARGTTILRRVGCLPTFRMREVAIGTLALAKATYGVELTDVGSWDVARLELAAVRALWGPTRTSRAKEVLGRSRCWDTGSPHVAPPVFESTLAGPLGTHAKSRTSASPGNTGGNRPPAGHRTSGQGLAVGPAAALGGRARLVGVARAAAARTATPGPGGRGRGMPPGAGVVAVHRFGGAGTAPTSHLWGAGGGGMQAHMHPGYDGDQFRDGALAAASTTSRGDVDRGAGPKASNFGFSSLPLLRGPPGDGGPPPMGLPAVARTTGRLAPAGAS